MGAVAEPKSKSGILSRARRNRGKNNKATSPTEEMAPPMEMKKKDNRIIDKPPTARESAFGGPPRYDWIDIETAAAVKVQSVFRRSLVMKHMEESGMTTAAMRNRMRARNSRQRSTASEDVPFALRFCGLGFLFGDATNEEREILEAHKKAQYEERKKQELIEDEKRRKFKMRRKTTENLLESVEVVDNL